MALPTPMVGAPISATGAIARAPLGTTLPTDASSALDQRFEELGLIGEDGVSLAQERSTDDIHAWGGSVVRKIQTEYSENFTFTLMESTKAEVLKAVYGADNVKVTGKNIAITHNATPAEPAVYVITMKDGDMLRRFVIPNGQLSVDGDTAYSHSDVIQYSASVGALNDEKGNSSYEYVSTGTTSTVSDSH